MTRTQRTAASPLASAALTLVLLLAGSQALAAETVIMSVVLNGENRGDYFLELEPGGVLLFAPEDLREMGLVNIPPGYSRGADGYVALEEVLGVTVEWNKRASSVEVTVPGEYFARRVINLSSEAKRDVFVADDFSAFLNYSLTYRMDESLGFTSLSLPWEVGASRGGVLGFSSFTYSKEPGGDNFTRLLTNVTVDDPARNRRYLVGDFSASSGRLGGGATIGGVSVSRNFSMSPHMVTSPGLEVSGVAETASTAEVYVNGNLVETREVPPGEFTFTNIREAGGGGEVELVIKDAYGRVKKVVRPFYLSTMLLRDGLHEYGYSLGVEREDLGRESFAYGGPVFTGFHRFGLTGGLTLGLRAEADEDVVNAGAEARFLVSRYGEVFVSAAHSRHDSGGGWGGIFSYAYSTGGLNFSLSASGFTRDYSNINITPEQDKARLDYSVRLGYSHGLLGSVSAAYSETDSYEAVDRKRTTFYYSRKLARSLTLFARASRTETGDTVDEVFAGLNYVFDGAGSGSVGFSARDGENTESLTYNRNAPLSGGFGYRAFVERREDAAGEVDTNGNATIRHRGRHGNYAADYRRASGADSYALSAAGALTYVDGSVHHSRPVRDSFALVRVGDVEGVMVKYSNQEAAVTDSDGEALVPDLVSYYENHLSIDTEDVPINYDIRRGEMYVTAPVRGGGVVEFEARRLQAFVGTLYVEKDGKKEAAEHWGLEVGEGEESFQVVVGGDGEFYLENLAAGTYPVRLFLGGRECRFELEVPGSDDIIVDMGEVTCEMD